MQPNKTMNSLSHTYIVICYLAALATLAALAALGIVRADRATVRRD